MIKSTMWTIYIATTVWAGYESKSLRITVTKKPYSLNNGSFAWSLSCTLLWLISFPFYLYRRRKVLTGRQQLSANYPSLDCPSCSRPIVVTSESLTGPFLCPACARQFEPVEVPETKEDIIDPKHGNVVGLVAIIAACLTLTASLFNYLNPSSILKPSEQSIVEDNEAVQSSISGNVFIKTTSGDRVSLPYVRICAVPKDHFDNKLAQQSDNYLPMFEEILEDYAEQISSIREFSESNSDTLTSLKEASNTLEDLKTTLGEYSPSENGDNFSFDATDSDQDRGFQISPTNKKILVSKTTAQDDAEQLLAKLNNLIGKLNSLRGSHYEKWDEFHKLTQEVEIGIGVAGAEVEGKSIKPNSDGKERFGDHRDVIFKSLLKEKFEYETISDGEGYFSLPVNPDEDYVLVAIGERSIGSDLEKYYWALEISRESLATFQTFSLSNADLVNDLHLLDLNPEATERRTNTATKISNLNIDLAEFTRVSDLFGLGIDGLGWELKDPMELYTIENLSTELADTMTSENQDAMEDDEPMLDETESFEDRLLTLSTNGFGSQSERNAFVEDPQGRSLKFRISRTNRGGTHEKTAVLIDILSRLNRNLEVQGYDRVTQEEFIKLAKAGIPMRVVITKDEKCGKCFGDGKLGRIEDFKPCRHCQGGTVRTINTYEVSW